MFEDKYTKASLIIAFSVAVVLLGVDEIHRRIVAQNYVQYKDANLVEHLYGVSAMEKGRYALKAFEKLQEERAEGQKRKVDRPKLSWKTLVKKIW